MSFSGKVKEELCKDFRTNKHCNIAETSAIIIMNGCVERDLEGKFLLKIQTENVTVARKYFTLLKKTYNISTELSIQNSSGLNKNRAYVLTVSNDETILKILLACHLIPEYEDAGIEPLWLVCKSNTEKYDLVLRDLKLLDRDCCKRAFIRGAFLAAGSVSDPRKSYHFEIVCDSEEQAGLLLDAMRAYDVSARVIRRKKYYVVYVKDSSMVVDLLNIMGAHNSLMDMENVRIVKDMRNQVNRKVNCETANINKTVSTAMKQIEDIRYIQKAGLFEELPRSVREIALIRIENPDVPLVELGRMLDEPVGKSGVNHRLKKISIFADEIRQKNQTEI